MSRQSEAPMLWNPGDDSASIEQEKHFYGLIDHYKHSDENALEAFDSMESEQRLRIINRLLNLANKQISERTVGDFLSLTAEFESCIDELASKEAGYDN